MDDAVAENRAQCQEQSRPCRARDQHADHENAIRQLEDAGRHSQRHAKAWNMPAEAERPRAVSAEPVLRLLQASRRQMEESRQAVLEQAPAVAPRDQVEVGGAKDDGEDEAEPRREQDREAVREGMADIDEEGVARDEQRDAGLLDIDQAEARKVAELAQHAP